MKRRLSAGILLTIAIVTGCTGLHPEGILLPRSEVSLTVKEEVVMAFDPATCQIGYNSERNEFRLVDNKVSDWVIFRSDAVPTDVGQKVKASLEYTSRSNIKTMTDLTFSVEKTAPDGTTWLWNKDKKIGIIIKVLQ
jgi:hypothetical protein